VGVAFETSLQRLDQPHRHAFWILGTHPGPVVGVPQFAALADLPPPKARAVLRRLAGGNLITPAGQRVGHVRYELHDLLREYARQQAQTHLPALQRSAALARLTSWYTTVMGAIDGLIEAPEGVPITEPVVEGLSLAGPGEVRAWLAAEQDNLLAVAEHATGEDAARVYCEYAWPLYRSDYHATARTLFRAAAGIYRQIGDRDGRAHSLTGLGYVALATSDFPGAAEHFDAALATYQQIGDPRGQAYVLTGLGRVALATGDYPGAAEQYGAALDIFRQVAEPAWQANSLAGLGRVALATGDYPGAAEQYEAALATYRQIGDLSGQAYALVGLGHVALATGDYPGAAGRYEAALGIYRQVGGRAWQADALTGLGRIALATGDYPGSAGHFEAALGICRQVGDRRGQADALAGLGRVTTADGRRDEARQRLSEALVIYVEIGSPLAGDVREDLDRLGRD
jgi:tetratricopeptide (TPR) repeat protein